MDNFYTEEELAEMLQNNKKMLDKAYLETKIKYGEKHAIAAMKEYLLKYDSGAFTGSETRSKLKEFTYHFNEFYQILLDYAISSYICEEENGISHNISLNEVRSYTDTANENLNYNPRFITSIVAVGTAFSPYWIVNVISCNDKLKQALVESFIKERYIERKKKSLDESKKIKYVKTDGKLLTMSKFQLNRDICNMNNDEEISFFRPFDEQKLEEPKRHQ